MPEWILASASPRRRDILSRLGLQFCTDPSRIPEPSPGPRETPSRYVLRMARMKAEAAGGKYASGMVIGADTAVALDGRLLGKPASREEAGTMIRSLGGRWHDVLSGLCLLDCATGRSRSGVSWSRVHFRPLAAGDIVWYLDTGEYRDKAGAYAVQGYASLIIDRIEGCYFTVVGFPVSLFDSLCRKSGVRLREHLGKRCR